MTKEPLTLSLDLPQAKRLAWWKSLAHELNIGVGVVRTGPDGKPLLDANSRPIKDDLRMLLDAESGRRVRLRPTRGPSKGRAVPISKEQIPAPITREQIVESVERHKATSCNLEIALNAAADELKKTDSREYKNLHRWYMDAKKALNKKS